MGKFFGVILVILVVVIGTEVYFLATVPAVKRSPLKAVQPVPSISPSPFPTASPEILAEIKRWRSRLPTKVSSYQSKKYGRVFNVQAALVSQEGEKIKARGENNEDLNFALNEGTQFFNRRGQIAKTTDRRQGEESARSVIGRAISAGPTVREGRSCDERWHDGLIGAQKFLAHTGARRGL